MRNRAAVEGAVVVEAEGAAAEAHPVAVVEEEAGVAVVGAGEVRR